jgi:dCMP deaminase
MLNYKDELGRALWDYYFLSLAFVATRRALDKHTKHGTIITDIDHNILTGGYNGAPRGCYDEFVPLDRELKYPWMRHSEESAIINAARIGTAIKNSTFYITGYPCSGCMGRMISAGVKRIVYGCVQSKCINEKDREISRQMLCQKKNKIEVVEIKDMQSIICVLEDTIDYIKEKSKK